MLTIFKRHNLGFFPITHKTRSIARCRLDGGIHTLNLGKCAYEYVTSNLLQVAALETRVTIRRDGALVINPVAADDSGQYLCEVSNGIGDPQSASAYLNVECNTLIRLYTYLV